MQLFKQALRNHDRAGAKTSLYLDLLHTNDYYGIYPVSSNNWKVARGDTKNRVQWIALSIILTTEARG